MNVEPGGVTTAGASKPDLQELTALSRRRQDRRMLVFGLFVAFGPVVGVMIALALRPAGTTLGPAAVLVLLAVVMLGPLLGFVLVVVMRARGVRWLQPSPFGGLSSAERKQLVRALRRGDPVPPGQEEVAAHLVGRIRAARWMPFVCWGACLLQIVHAWDGGWSGRFGQVFFVIGVIGLAYSFWVNGKIASRRDL